MDIQKVQAALADQSLDGWLLYDFRGTNELAGRVLGIDPAAHATRRWFYFVPVQGEPRKLVHRIEAGALDHLPGDKTIYLKWQELEAGVAEMLRAVGRVAMEYSPRNANPYIAKVDAGTIELVRGCDVEVVGSGDLIQLFEATWSDEQWAMHQEAAAEVLAAQDAAFRLIADRTAGGGEISETQVQDTIMNHFAAANLVTDHPPIVGVGPNSGNPHYAPQPGSDGVIREGEFVLIDSWAKCDRPHAVFADFTQTGFVGADVPQQFTKIFNIVAAARDAGIACVEAAFATGRPLQGWEVDDATRAVIDDAGYGDYFRHRTGHSIGQETHGNGAHMDNLEMHEDRHLMPRTCFSIEPGIYLPEFGVRSEINVYIDRDGKVHVTGERQMEIRRIVPS